MTINSKLLCLILIVVNSPKLSYAYTGNTFNDISEAIFSVPYIEMPTYQVRKEYFGSSGSSNANKLRQAALRTLSTREDLFDFPNGQKLLQPNGICFSGEWIIDNKSPFTGQFTKGTHSLIIARASVSLSGTSPKHKRSFSMAVKLFPTAKPQENVQTLNLFVMESIVGTYDKYFLDTIMDNEPALGGIPSFADLGIALRLYKDLNAVDKQLSPAGPKFNYRPVSHLDMINSEKSGKLFSPKWLRLSIANETPRIEASDFREELRINHYPGQNLTWIIDVAADNDNGKSSANWLTIGKLIFNRSVTSKACDIRLHFAHPILIEE